MTLIERLEARIIVDGCEMPGNDALHREAAERLRKLEAVREAAESGRSQWGLFSYGWVSELAEALAACGDDDDK